MTFADMQAVRNDRFWILIHPEYANPTERRTRGILSAGQVVAGETL